MLKSGGCFADSERTSRVKVGVVLSLSLSLSV